MMLKFSVSVSLAFVVLTSSGCAPMGTDPALPPHIIADKEGYALTDKKEKIADFEGEVAKLVDDISDHAEK